MHMPRACTSLGAQISSPRLFTREIALVSEEYMTSLGQRPWARQIPSSSLLVFSVLSFTYEVGDLKTPCRTSSLNSCPYPARSIEHEAYGFTCKSKAFSRMGYL